MLFLGLGLGWGCCVHTAESCDGQAREPWSRSRKKLGYVNDEVSGLCRGLKQGLG